jgi:hypothetical protein
LEFFALSRQVVHLVVVFALADGAMMAAIAYQFIKEIGFRRSEKPLKGWHKPTQ